MLLWRSKTIPRIEIRLDCLPGMLMKRTLCYKRSSALDSIPDRVSSSQGCLLQPDGSTPKRDSWAKALFLRWSTLSDHGFTTFYFSHLVQLLAYSRCQKVFVEWMSNGEDIVQRLPLKDPADYQDLTSCSPTLHPFLAIKRYSYEIFLLLLG